MEIAMSRRQIVNNFFEAVRNGQLEDAKELIRCYSLSYSPEWSEGYCLLLEAIRNRHPEMAELLLANNCKVNRLYPAPYVTPLHVAVETGYINIVSLLLDKHANPNSRDENNKTPLHYAIERFFSSPLLKTRMEIIELLVDRGADVNARDRYGKKPLHSAVDKDDLRIAKILLDRRADPDGADREGMTPLHHAIQSFIPYKHSKTRMEMIELLLDREANVNARDAAGKTPLYIAVEKNHIRIVEYLLDRGANVDTSNMQGKSPLHHALECSPVKRSSAQMEIIELLLFRGANVNVYDHEGKMPLHLAVDNGDTEIVETLLDRQANPDAGDKMGKTPLHHAIESYFGSTFSMPRMKIIELLVSRGANVNVCDHDAKMPLHIAVDADDIKTVMILLRRQANPNSRDMKGRTPLHYALERFFSRAEATMDIIELLVDHEANVNACDYDGKMPLHVAVDMGHVEILKIFLYNGADPEPRDMEGKTPLHYAIERFVSTANERLGWTASSVTMMEIIELLVDRGANVNACDSDGKIPLHVAVQKDDTAIVEFFLDRRADPDTRDKMGKTPLHYAIESCSRSKTRMETIELLVNRGASVNVEDAHGTTPLHVSSMGHEIVMDFVRTYRIADYLLNRGADINCVSNEPGRERYTPLHFASSNVGSADLVKFLLNNGADVNAISERHLTPLYLATRIGDDEIVKVLLDHGADVDIEDSNGNTILQVAVEAGRSKIVERLLASRPDASNENNINSLKYAVYALDTEQLENNLVGFIGDDNTDSEYRTIVNDLLLYGFKVAAKDGNDRDLLNAAVATGCLQIVGDLLNYGADVDMLHTAVVNDQTQMVKLLLDHGANVNATNRSSSYYEATHKVPIFYAIRNGNVDITRLLLTDESRVNVNADILNAAVTMANREIVSILLERDPGADINAVDKNGVTALHCTALSKRDFLIGFGRNSDIGSDNDQKDEIARLLLKRGANVDARCTDGRTALHAAAMYGRARLVEYLLEYSADVNSVNKYGKTAIHLAAHYNHLDVVMALLKFGGNIDSRNNEGQTALHIAAGQGNLQIFVALLDRGADINVTSYEYDRTAADYTEKANSKIRDVFKQHIIKLVALNQHVSRKNLHWIGDYTVDPKLNDFLKECKDEIDKLRSMTINDNNVTYHDILVKDIHQLTMYARNRSIERALDSRDHDHKFPIYSKMIDLCFERGRKRGLLLNSCSKIICFISGCGLPELITDHVFNYLSNKQLENLMEACSNTNIGMCK